MKTLYFDCQMGASGNMLLGALLELCDDRDEALRRLNALGVPGAQFSRAEVAGPPAGSLVTVTVHGHDEDAPHPHHHGCTLDGVLAQIAGLNAPEAVKAQAARVYRAIAEAEAEVHGATPSEVHFHEVGSLDAVCDIVGTCLLLHGLGPVRVCCAGVTAGSGTVRCAHGLLPVPAPATELLLRGIPWRQGDVTGELCTPTGAALLRELCATFAPMPAMRVEKTGCGYGSRVYDRPNCLRALLGEAAETVCEVRCNLDDMTGEDLAFAREALEAGPALDVTMTQTLMKKGRPGVILTCLCREADLDETIRLLLRHTTTGGVRYAPMARVTLETGVRAAETAFGPVRVKTYAGGDVRREKPEFEDLAALAREADRPLSELRAAVAQGERLPR
ncbi:MAG: nickel pincer cofactor biosynthesis protein LarC [Oscillospiraceae bacterium]|nr:nickel pincer cofactor biosynthesis protein LarC [Oscillospiraceae bacterium]